MMHKPMTFRLPKTQLATSKHPPKMTMCWPSVWDGVERSADNGSPLCGVKKS